MLEGCIKYIYYRWPLYGQWVLAIYSYKLCTHSIDIRSHLSTARYLEFSHANMTIFPILSIGDSNEIEDADDARQRFSGIEWRGRLLTLLTIRSLRLNKQWRPYGCRTLSCPLLVASVRHACDAGPRWLRVPARNPSDSSSRRVEVGGSFHSARAAP